MLRRLWKRVDLLRWPGACTFDAIPADTETQTNESAPSYAQQRIPAKVISAVAML